MRVQLLEVFFGLCVALFVFFGLAAMREVIIRRFIEEHCEVIERSDEHGEHTSGESA
jgi:hypothetical protein